ncbi:MAG TPA: LCP family protein [Mycobacterium sp.]|uniref:LCP family protein n=1 Tax=Mycobacterium sp. TaxID=1785 RepID=UPI002D66C95C|nr:LCP family protein [Mycobacterium sp.]HZU48961.1 LCP family protein [Mycobacterium sp.]
MTHRADAPGDGKARSTSGIQDRRYRNHSIVVGAKVLAALVSTVAVVVTGIAWSAYRTASAGITRSDALAGEPESTGSEQNILIMGLDSRRDQRGQPLSPEIYDALHAGDEDTGENDADALILLHLPAGDAPATAVSIPRDDYVDLAGCSRSDCRGKVKEAYRLAYQAVMDGSANALSGTAGAHRQDPATKEQTAREGGRKAEISTVRRLLQVPIDHFIEVTLVGFFQIAKVVEPITVCLNEDTSDRYYSGADFHRGRQQITAAQAMAFVRQRRDADNAAFTDLDRTRRQQAFIASLVSALRRSGVVSNPERLHKLLDVAKQNVAVDAGFNLEEFLRNASAHPNRPVALYTLPVTDFTETSYGEDVNVVDVSGIRTIVHNLVGNDSPAAAASTSESESALPSAGGVTLDVVNASGKEGEAASLQKSLATNTFTAGKVSTAESTRQTSTIAYGPGAKTAATELADELNITAAASDTVAPDTVQLTVGTDFTSFDYPHRMSASPTTTTGEPVTTVPATGTGTREPTPNNLTRMTADDIPCVK